MLHHLGYMIDRLNAHPEARGEPAGGHLTVAIRRALDADMPLLHDLAELDSAKLLEGPALVAVVEGSIWAAVALDDGRVIADPFLPTGPAVELLVLRVQQLRAAAGAPRHGLRPRWTGRRARA